MCAGSCCDQQRLSDSEMEKCGCFQTTHAAKVTLRCDVKLPTSEKYSSSGDSWVMLFSSWNTAQLFVTDISWNYINPTDFSQRQSLREKMKGIEAYINNKGGWTVVGWSRTGVVTDVSSSDDRDNLASANQKPHISYLYPSDPEVVDSNEYKSLKFNYSPTAVAGLLPMAGLPDNGGTGGNAINLEVESNQEEEDNDEENEGDDDEEKEDNDEEEEDSDNTSSGDEDEEETAGENDPAPPRRLRRRNDNPVAVARGRGRGRRR
jgi:hypothetical protein